MTQKITIFLEHILINLNKIESHLQKVSKAHFLKDENLQDATLRRLEIIGEAVKNIPATFRDQHPEIPWTDIAATRDKIIHHYFGVDLITVWKIIKNDLPKLQAQISEIMQEL